MVNDWTSPFQARALPLITIIAEGCNEIFQLTYLSFKRSMLNKVITTYFLKYAQGVIFLLLKVKCV